MPRVVEIPVVAARRRVERPRRRHPVAVRLPHRVAPRVHARVRHQRRRAVPQFRQVAARVVPVRHRKPRLVRRRRRPAVAVVGVRARERLRARRRRADRRGHRRRSRRGGVVNLRSGAFGTPALSTAFPTPRRHNRVDVPIRSSLDDSRPSAPYSRIRKFGVGGRVSFLIYRYWAGRRSRVTEIIVTITCRGLSERVCPGFYGASIDGARGYSRVVSADGPRCGSRRHRTPGASVRLPSHLHETVADSLPPTATISTVSCANIPMGSPAPRTA